MANGCPCFSRRTAWVQKIKAASEQYIDTEKKKREKAYQGIGVPGGCDAAPRGLGMLATAAVRLMIWGWV